MWFRYMQGNRISSLQEIEFPDSLITLYVIRSKLAHWTFVIMCAVISQAIPSPSWTEHVSRHSLVECKAAYWPTSLMVNRDRKLGRNQISSWEGATFLCPYIYYLWVTLHLGYEIWGVRAYMHACMHTYTDRHIVLWKCRWQTNVRRWISADSWTTTTSVRWKELSSMALSLLCMYSVLTHLWIHLTLLNQKSQ
jgi:hypothetical protein